MIILAVRGRSWIVGVSVVDSFEFCSIYFFQNNLNHASASNIREVTKFYNL